MPGRFAGCAPTLSSPMPMPVDRIVTWSVVAAGSQGSTRVQATIAGRRTLADRCPAFTLGWPTRHQPFDAFIDSQLQLSSSIHLSVRHTPEITALDLSVSRCHGHCLVTYCSTDVHTGECRTTFNSGVWFMLNLLYKEHVVHRPKCVLRVHVFFYSIIRRLTCRQTASDD